MIAWILEETQLCVCLKKKETHPKMAKMQAPVSKQITACPLTNTGTINDAHAQWNSGQNTSRFSAVRVGLLLSPCVEFRANS